MDRHRKCTHSSKYLSSREMEYHTMTTTRTRASMARNFQPATYMHRGAGDRAREGQPPSLPILGPSTPSTADPSQGLGSKHFCCQDEERIPGSQCDSLSTLRVSQDVAKDDCWTLQCGGSPWTTLTGLAGHVSQQIAGFLRRSVIPAASGHLGDKSSR